MNIAKTINLTAGVVLLVCGIVACLYPSAVGEYYGMTFVEMDAKTTVRVFGGFCCGVAYLLMYFAWRLEDQIPLLFSLAVILLSFAAPRLLGLIMDGFDQQKMVYELVFEVVSLVFVICTLLKISGTRAYTCNKIE